MLVGEKKRNGMCVNWEGNRIYIVRYFNDGVSSFILIIPRQAPLLAAPPRPNPFKSVIKTTWKFLFIHWFIPPHIRSGGLCILSTLTLDAPHLNAII